MKSKGRCSDMSENGYIAYQTMVSKAETSADALKRICRKMDLQEQAETLGEVSSRLQNHVFRIGIMGEFKRGKSTVINALLGQEIVPADILPCSATLNRIVWDATPHARINFKQDENGEQPESKDIPVEELSDYITKLTTESEAKAETVEDSIVYYPCRFCQNGVEIIDTPGLNDDERMDRISESVIPTLDAIIMVVVPGSPFGISEASFVRNKIMTSDLGRLIFVVNKIDTIRRKADREKAVDGIRRKIEETVLEKAAAVYGEDSQEYQATRAKLGGIRIYPISAADALDGKLENDEELVAESGMPAFEEALTKLLTEERGLLELVPMISSILSKLKEADETIVMRTNAMNLKQEQFAKVKEEAVEKINRTREEKKKKVEDIRNVADSICMELQPDVVEAYGWIEDALTEYVDQYEIAADCMSDEGKTNSFQAEVTAGINRRMESAMQESTEKMQIRINDRLGTEMDGLTSFGKKLDAEISDIRGLVSMPSDPSGAGKFGTMDAVAIGVETVTNFTSIVPGLGGAISGFKEHGVLGGLVGFGTGYALTNAAAFTTAFLLTSIGISASAVMIPALLISGVIGGFGGKKITDMIFRKFGKQKDRGQSGEKELSEKEILAIRARLKESVLASIQELRKEQAIENWLKTATNDTFTALSEKLDRETEEVLKSLQDTLTNIQIDIGKDEAQKEVILKQLNDDHQELIQIAEAIAPVKERLNAVLSAKA